MCQSCSARAAVNIESSSVRPPLELPRPGNACPWRRCPSVAEGLAAACPCAAPPLGIVAEAARADLGVARLDVDVQHGRMEHAHAHGALLAGDGAVGLENQAVVPVAVMPICDGKRFTPPRATSWV